MRRTLGALGALAAVATLASPALAGSAKITICHATSSATNPYVKIAPASAGVLHGHLGHHDARDIVPPFTYKGATHSQNWDAAGQAIHANGCAVPEDGGGEGGGGFEF